jgi:phytoene synthase
MTPELTRFMIFQVERARRFFREADPVVGLFPRDGSRLTVRLLQQTYAGILDVIEEQHYDVFRQRAFTTSRRKLAILARAFWDQRFRTAAVGGVGSV